MVEYITVITSLLRAWQRGNQYLRLSMKIGAALILVAIGIALLGESSIIDKRITDPIALTIGILVLFLILSIYAYQSFIEQQDREQKIESVEEKLREHPEKPQLAWDLARTKLENYLDRNLSQVQSIYFLTLLVMLCGFGFVMYGLYQAAHDPGKLPVSIVASASGVLISFIGGSFLVIYRSILAQSKEYVTVLERINAVGMAVQVIASIPDENEDLKHQTTADLAKQLLHLYSDKLYSDKRKPKNERSSS